MNGQNGQNGMSRDDMAAMKERCRKAIANMPGVLYEPQPGTPKNNVMWMALCLGLCAAILVFLLFVGCHVANSPLLHDHDQPARVMADQSAGEAR